ncbi:MAG: hypothetical protein IVW36_02450 [Dehalococcoidia bacterium]|nr:hypothetical protein [Dehalococcoidia bacterium]
MRKLREHRLASLGIVAFTLGVVAALIIVRMISSGGGCSSAADCEARSAAASGQEALTRTPDADATASPATATAPTAGAESTPGAQAVATPERSGAPGSPGGPAAPSGSGSAPPAPGGSPRAPSSATNAGSAPPSAPPAAASGPASNFDTTVCPQKLDVLGRSQCGSPPRFCDTWSGGFCNDYRTKQTTAEVAFPQPGDGASLDCLSSTNAGQTAELPYYVTTNNAENSDVSGAQTIPFPCGISFREHFMTRLEDGQFGMAVMRLQRPFDFAGRTGRIRFDVDLSTLERRYVRLVLTPQLTKTAVDERNGQPVTDQSLEVWFRNGTFQVSESQGGQLVDQYPECNGCGARYEGTPNTRDSVDVYVSRTRIRIDVNGKTQVDTAIQDIGFDRAYVYLDQLNYNSCKAYATEGYATIAECQVAGNMFHWDNVAFDGPTLPVNGLTPAGSEDAVFNAWSAASCSVKGVPARGSGRDSVWQTWVARLPAGTPVTAADVTCAGGGNDGFRWYQGAPMGLEIVQQ